MSDTRTAVPAGVALAVRPDALADLTAEILAAETAADLSRAERVLPVANAMVQEYAPRAPGPMQVEAAIRFGGYLLQSDYGALVKEGIGPQEVEYTLNHGDVFRRCGAKALLAPWRVRTAAGISGSRSG